MDLHRLGEARSLAMHRAIAARLPSEPRLLAMAKARVHDWLRSRQVHPEYAQAWAKLLDQPIESVAIALTTDDESGRALRQVSPFAGALDARTRWQIRREVARAAR